MILIAELINHFVNGIVNMATVKKTIKKAQRGYVTKDSKGNYSQLNKYKTDAGDRYYRSTSKDLQMTGDMNDLLSSRNSADSVRYSTLTPREKKVMEEQRNGGKTVKKAVKKAQSGKEVTKDSKPGLRVVKTEKERKGAVLTGDEHLTRNRQTGDWTRVSRFKTDDGLRFYKSTNQDEKTTKKINDSLANTRSADSVKSKDLTDREKKHFNTQRSYMLTKADKQLKKGGKVAKAKSGKQMIKRADGSVSQRGLWDNIRAAKGSGKKPTAAMLKQEKKIKLTSKKK